jgi:hypothetical protein
MESYINTCLTILANIPSEFIVFKWYLIGLFNMAPIVLAVSIVEVTNAACQHITYYKFPLLTILAFIPVVMCSIFVFAFAESLLYPHFIIRKLGDLCVFARDTFLQTVEKMKRTNKSH